MNCELPPYEEVSHTADLALGVRGDSLAELFAHAAEGMFALMHHPRGDEELSLNHRILLRADDPETLLVDWLGELLYLSESKRARYDVFHVHRVTPTVLEATVDGQRAPPPERGIKAVTFSGLEIVRTCDGYECQITFDV